MQSYQFISTLLDVKWLTVLLCTFLSGPDYCLMPYIAIALNGCHCIIAVVLFQLVLLDF